VRGIERVRDHPGDAAVERQPDVADRVRRAGVLDVRVRHARLVHERGVGRRDELVGARGDDRVGTKSFYEVFESREACYVALLDRVTDRIGATMVAALRDALADETEAGRVLLSAFAHALVDDPRLARATFGEAPGISRAVEELIADLTAYYDVVRAGVRR